MRNGRSSHWSERLFVDHADLFVKVFRSQKGTNQEVEGLARIFDEFRVPRGSRVLDVACGVGRHAIPLAKRGYSVTGIDFSPVFIAKARSDARRQKISKRTRFLTGDLRSGTDILRGAAPFNAITSLWSSIGYFGQDEDFRLIKTLGSLASLSCLLVVDSVNRDWIIHRSGQASVSDLGRFELHERPKLNLETSHVENVWRFYEKRGKDLKLVAEAPFSMRCYSLHELKGLVENAGWRYLKSYGGFDLRAFERESGRIIACCRLAR